MKSLLLPICALALIVTPGRGADTTAAARAINELGLELFRGFEAGNAVLSPLSIQLALAMTYAGAEGDTRAEMQRVLHYPSDDKTLHASFGALAGELDKVASESVRRVEGAKKFGGPSTPIEFHLAQRLFGQERFPFRKPFLNFLSKEYAAPLEELDFGKAKEARARINRWVEEQTKSKIRDLIPPDGLDPSTTLVLVSAVYLRAPWADQFKKKDTVPERFLADGREGIETPTMVQQVKLGYAKHDGFTALALPYDGGDLQFLILLPDKIDGLSALERAIDADLLKECAKLDQKKAILHLPKFRLEPPTASVGETLQRLGMMSAFDRPSGSANFDRMAPRRPDDYLFIGSVFHKAFLALDEEGTEAAAATAVTMLRSSAMPPDESHPMVIRVDHPFLFAIQHVTSSACLFLGRLSDPR